nr:ABC transporter F family member 4-like isoform X3 [Ipomoea trifida]
MKKKEQSMLKNDDKKGIGVDEDDNIDENMEKGGYEEDVGHEYLEGELLHVNIDENLDDEEGYEEEDSGEGYLEAEHKVKNHEIYIVDNLEEGYEEEEAIDIGIGKYLEGEHKEEDEKEYENLDEGYAGEYLEGEGEHQEKNEISIDEDLEEGYEEDIGDFFKKCSSQNNNSSCSITNLIILTLGQFCHKLCNLIVNIHLLQDGCTIICDGVVTVKALKHLVHAFGVERGTATHEESVSTALVLSADLLRELRLKPANRETNKWLSDLQALTRQCRKLRSRRSDTMLEYGLTVMEVENRGDEVGKRNVYFNSSEAYNQQ